MAIEDPAAALVAHASSGSASACCVQAIGVFGAVALGAWAARRRLLDEPERHRALLRAGRRRRDRRGGAARAADGADGRELWTSPPTVVVLLAGTLHALGGYAGGIGYAALFGLLAIRIARRGAPGRSPVPAGLRAAVAVVLPGAVGRRSSRCCRPGRSASATTRACGSSPCVGFGTWLVILVVAAVSERAGYRGPAEVLLRRLTYGARA